MPRRKTRTARCIWAHCGHLWNWMGICLGGKAARYAGIEIFVLFQARDFYGFIPLGERIESMVCCTLVLSAYRVGRESVFSPLRSVCSPSFSLIREEELEVTTCRPILRNNDGYLYNSVFSIPHKKLSPDVIITNSAPALWSPRS